MKALTLTLSLFIAQFAFGQQIYTGDQVDQHAIYPKNCEKEKSVKDCFSKSISVDLGDLMGDVAEQFKEKSYVTRVNFVINEDGSISDIRSSTNDEFGQKTAKVLEMVFAKNELSDKKIQPAVLNGKNVKMSYSLPVRLQNM
ncbi:energy transducer TonB [Faecalibacter macacae]|uniref:TonB C-terminal domain-containing protein n=1 Tax=Faecalibacter macacae TaxID=1859289 RepID=A0A3L9M5L2_9FLAO|nr:hypothetical protein [Faecalibacter macacae]RLZ08061.1 hypothetical protein EAH69_10715 [Faecalibacter macacae]